jgi:hypothetical protein
MEDLVNSSVTLYCLIYIKVDQQTGFTFVFPPQLHSAKVTFQTKNYLIEEVLKFQTLTKILMGLGFFFFKTSKLYFEKLINSKSFFNQKQG